MTNAATGKITNKEELSSFAYFCSDFYEEVTKESEKKKISRDLKTLIEICLDPFLLEGEEVIPNFFDDWDILKEVDFKKLIMEKISKRMEEGSRINFDEVDEFDALGNLRHWIN